MKKVNDLFKISKGKKAEESEIDTGLRYVQIGDLRNDDIYKFAVKNTSNVLCNKNDILIAWDGANAGTIGYNLDGVIGSTLAKLTPKVDGINVDYVGRFLQSKFKYLREHCTGATIPHISRPILESLQIPLPPLPQQQKIANILDAADALRQKDKALLAKYDELTQSLFLDMFGDPVSNPKGWEIMNLGEITDLVTDGKHGNCSDEPGSGYYFVSAKDIRNNKINYLNSREIPKAEFEEVDKRTNLQPGDLVMINTGATIGRMAIASDIPETRRSTFQKSVAVIKVKKDIISSFFLQYVFELGLETFANMGSGSAIKNLLLSEMRRFNIILPSLHLQNQFAERVQVIEQQKAIAQKSLEKSEELFNSLLQKAFKGELVSLI
jgi:type I restriction enzyme S subunit